jgi:hypothetical protein
MADIDRMAQLQPRSCVPPICAAVMTLLAGRDVDRAIASLDLAIALEPNFTLSYALRAYVRGKKTAWLPATSDVLLAIRRLALIKFKFGVVTKRLGEEQEQGRFFFTWEYTFKNNAPRAEQDALKPEREVIQLAISNLAAAMLAPSN